MKNKFIILHILGLLFCIGCATVQKNEDKLIWSSHEKRPEWTIKEPYEEKDKLIFVGLSYGFSTEKDARDDALNTAIKNAVKYIGSDVKVKITNMITSYGLSREIRNPTVVAQQVEEQLSQAFLSRIKAQEWYIEKYKKNSKVYYSVFLLANVPKNEIDRSIEQQLEEQRKIAESASKTQQSVLQALEIFGKAKQNDDFKLSINTDRGPGAGFKDGEKIKYKIKSNKECYLYVFNVNSLGEMSVLFPNPWSKDKKLKSGIEYILPDESMDFDFIVTSPYGSEIVVAIATLEEINGLKPNYNKKEFKTIGDINSAEVKKISELIKNIPDSKKAVSTYVLTTYGE